jgi:FKBP-type peptidyl-prolyl cis-trans isomerase 2
MPKNAEHKSEAIKQGDKVMVDYEGTFDDGTVFDSSKHEEHSHPLEFQAGSGQVIKGFDNAVIGMKIGEEKKFRIEAKDAYGDINPQLAKKVPRAALPKDQEPKVGMMLALGMPNGQQIPATITEVTADTITIDLNHPLAGKALNFKIKVVGIEPV